MSEPLYQFVKGQGWVPSLTFAEVNDVILGWEVPGYVLRDQPVAYNKVLQLIKSIPTEVVRNPELGQAMQDAFAKFLTLIKRNPDDWDEKSIFFVNKRVIVGDWCSKDVNGEACDICFRDLFTPSMRMLRQLWTELCLECCCYREVTKVLLNWWNA